MTTILSNGYYLIGDKRTSHTTPATKTTILESNLEGFVHSRLHRKTQTDETKKVIPLPKTTFEGKAVLAIAGAGNVERINEAYNFFTVMSIDAYASIKKSSKQHTPLHSFLFITEDFHSHRIVFTFSGQFTSLQVIQSSFKPGHVIASGSGGSLINELQERTHNKLNEGHPLSAFLLGTNTDAGSSNCYDVYGVREKKYFSKIIPTTEAVTSHIKEAMSLIDLSTCRKQHFFKENKAP